MSQVGSSSIKIDQAQLLRIILVAGTAFGVSYGGETLKGLMSNRETVVTLLLGCGLVAMYDVSLGFLASIALLVLWRFGADDTASSSVGGHNGYSTQGAVQADTQVDSEKYIGSDADQPTQLSENNSSSNKTVKQHDSPVAPATQRGVILAAQESSAMYAEQPPHQIAAACPGDPGGEEFASF